MTLPSSGPLSLNDIQTEFGGTNPIGINEYYAGGAYVPAGTSGTYGAVPSSGAISIQNFYGTANPPPTWLSEAFGVVSNNTYGTGIAVDSSGNVYVIGPQSTNKYPTLLKYNRSGSLVWQKEIAFSCPQRTCSVALDSSQQPVILLGNNPQVTAKFDTSGNLLWWSQLTGSGTTITSTDAQYPTQMIAVDGSDNIYAVQYCQDSGGAYGILVVRRNSSGVVQWVRNFSTPSVIPQKGVGVSVDSSGNAIIGGSFRNGNDNAGVAYAINSSGTGLWSTILQGIACCGYYPPANFAGAITGTDGTIYVVGTYKDWTISYQAILVAAFNGTTRARLWSRLIGPNASPWGSSIVRDSSNNLYVLGTGYTGGYAVSIAKYNSSGVIQWQRQIVGPMISCTQSQLYAGDITLASDSVMSICFTYSWSSVFSRFLTIQLPTDGSKTGTYTVDGLAFTYSASTYTTGNTGSVNTGGAGNTTYSFAYSESTTPPTISAGTMSTYTTNIP